MIYIFTNSIDYKLTIFAILGGLGIFLFGISLMSDSLKRLAGAKLKLFLEKTTNTPLKGILVGILMTSLIQSSTVTSALVVGLVSAGLMGLPQAVGVIFGANIGTTFTSILISLNIGQFALPIIFVGAVVAVFLKKKKAQFAGRALMGFGMLYFGLSLIGDALNQVVALPWFTNFLNQAGDKPILGFLVGIITTLVIQSSSATIGILQQIYATGAIPLVGAIAIVLGDNIGTTITSIMAATGGNANAKKTALVHVMFNTFGAVLFMVLLYPYTKFIELFSTWIGINHLNSKFTISLAHVFFNLFTVLILFWFVKRIVWLVNKIIPKTDVMPIDDVILDKQLLKKSADLALENAKKAIIDMAHITQGMLEFSYKYIFEDVDKAIEYGIQSEEVLNNIDTKIHNYLVDIGAHDLTEEQMQEVAKNIDTITDLERIGDHLDNLFEFYLERKDKKIPMHEDTKVEMLNLYDIIRSQLKKAIEAYQKNDSKLANQIIKQEIELNKLVKTYRNNHVLRINDKTCTENSAGYYVDILSNIERIGDHCHNIAENVLNKHYVYRKKGDELEKPKFQKVNK